MALDLFLKGSNRPVIRGTLKDISDALWEVQESINAGSFGIDAASVTFDPTSTDMSATDVDAAIKANWTDIRNIDIDGNTRTILIRADTAANLASADAVLAEFELVYESDTGLSKLGDGATAYTFLPYTSTGSLQHSDVFPEPGLVESVAGAFVLDWDTDFGGPRIVKLVRAAGDVSESLLVTLPEIPSGDWATVLVTEPMTFVAPNRTFVLAASWTDTLGVGTVTITESGVTTATLGLAAGDVVSGGPFGSQTTIATIESDSVFTTTDPCGGTSSGTINIVAPAYSIDGNRLLGSPAMGPSGVLMQFTVMAPSTLTTRGEVKTPERVGAEAAGVSYDPSASALTATQVQAAIDELKVGIDGLSTAIDDLPIGAISTSRGFTFPAPSANVVTLTLDDLASDVSGSVIYERIRGILNDSPSTAIRVDLPIEAVAGDAVLLYHDETQAGTVTIQNVGAVGSVNGEASLASNGPGAFVLLVCKSNAGSAPTWRTGGIRELVQVLIRGYCEAVNTATVSSSAAITFTYTSQNANIIEYTLGADPASFAISGVPSGRAFALMVKIKMDATGGRTWPHPSGCLFAEGTAPTIDTSSNGITWLTYLVTPNGTFCFEGGKAWAVA